MISCLIGIHREKWLQRFDFPDETFAIWCSKCGKTIIRGISEEK